MSRQGGAWLAVVAAALLAGCSGNDNLRSFAIVRRADVWQAVIRDADRGRLAGLADAWEQAGADISAAGAEAAQAALGPAALPPPASMASPAAMAAGPALPQAGPHQCRTIDLGWRQGAPRHASPVVAGDWAPCRLVADGILLRLETAPGPRQLSGALYPDVDRLIYLGSVRLAGEMGRLAYGDDGMRDQLGVLQTLAAGHWRIAMPWPRWTARLTVIEIRRTPDAA